MSSVFALKASPHTAMHLPRKRVAEALADLAAEHVLLRLVHLLDGVHHAQRLAASAAVRCSALTSFGKHEPPKPAPG